MKIHGTIHAARVCLLTAVLAELDGVPEDEIYALMLAAVIHDLGRVNNSNDAGHGDRSAEVADRLNRELIEDVARFHSRGDRASRDILYARHIQLFKDADALDRVRSDDLDPNYLRSRTAVALIKDAEDLLKWTSNIFTRLDESDPGNPNIK